MSKILRPLVWPFRKLFWLIFASKLRFTLIAIILAAIFMGFVNYPTAWDKSVDGLNDFSSQSLNKAIGWSNNSAPWLEPFFVWLNKIPALPHFFNLPFRLGLDLQGGTHLLYEADLSEIDKGEYDEAMQGIRDVIERRVNMFGVAEPLVQITKAGNSYRLVVELAGIADVHQAIAMIGETPALDFRETRTEAEISQLQAQGVDYWQAAFRRTQLNGRFIKKAQLVFDPDTNRPYVSLEFDSQGAEIFAGLTEKNIGQPIAIFLDEVPISVPTVQERIGGGKAQISGSFSVEEAKTLVQRLNAGALPVPIKLLNQQTIGASLGRASLDKSLQAALIGLSLVGLFMILYYRLPGLVAVASLLIYLSLVLAIFKFIPVTLTLAGIAGFILSLGMAVDANILIFARMREELQAGRHLSGAIDEGFVRAWPSIRDSNISTLLICLILYLFTVGLVKGFALTLGIGVVVSMFSAVFVTRNFLKATIGWTEKRLWLYGRKTNG